MTLANRNARDVSESKSITHSKERFDVVLKLTKKVSMHGPSLLRIIIVLLHVLQQIRITTLSDRQNMHFGYHSSKPFIIPNYIWFLKFAVLDLTQPILIEDKCLIDSSILMTAQGDPSRPNHIQRSA